VDGVFCNNCGHRNPASANFCSSCGGVLGPPTADTTVTLHPVDAQGEAGDESANVGEVVDADAEVVDHGAEANHQVDSGEFDDHAAEAAQLIPGKRQGAVGEQNDEDAGDAEDSARGARADLEQRVRVVVPHHCEADTIGHAEQVSGDAGEHVDGDHAKGADQRFAQDAEVPEAPHVGCDVPEADVDEGGGKQAPPFGVEDEPGLVGAVTEQIVVRGLEPVDAVGDHPDVDSDVDGEQEVGAGCGAGVPDVVLAVPAGLFGGVGLGGSAGVGRVEDFSFGLRWWGRHGDVSTLPHFPSC